MSGAGAGRAKRAPPASREQVLGMLVGGVVIEDGMDELASWHRGLANTAEGLTRGAGRQVRARRPAPGGAGRRAASGVRARQSAPSRYTSWFANSPSLRPHADAFHIHIYGRERVITTRVSANIIAVKGE